MEKFESKIISMNLSSLKFSGQTFSTQEIFLTMDGGDTNGDSLGLE